MNEAASEGSDAASPCSTRADCGARYWMLKNSLKFSTVFFQVAYWSSSSS